MANVRASPQQMVMVIAGAAGGEVYSINFPAHLWQQTTPFRSFDWFVWFTKSCRVAKRITSWDGEQRTGVPRGEVMVVVRRITEADIAGFREALDAVARESGFLRGNQAPPVGAVESFVLGNLSKKNPQFVAVADGEIVGWCDIVRGGGMHERHLGELGMGVVAPWRGRGIGRQLLTDTVDAADIERFLRIELSVHSDNIRAFNLYRDFGFHEEGRMARARLKGNTAVDVIMMARLRPDAEWPLHITSG